MFWTLTYYHSTYNSKSKSNTKTGGLEASLYGRCPLSVFPFKIEGVHQPVEKKLFVSATFTVWYSKRPFISSYWFSCTIWPERGQNLNWIELDDDINLTTSMLLLHWIWIDPNNGTIVFLQLLFFCLISKYRSSRVFIYLFLEHAFLLLTWNCLET